MAFDGFITKSVITELKNTIIGAKVNKVFEPTKNDVVLSLYNNGNNYLLDLCANPEFCRICLTSHSKQNPQNAYNFCMLLRKYLIGGKITKISNYDLERTVEIQFECYNDLNDLVKRKLFVEIMSRQSNIILTNENNIILDTLKHFDNNVRELLPAHEYVFTPINKISFLETSFDDLIELKNNSECTSITHFFMDTFIGFSKPLIKETISNLKISDEDFSNENLQVLYDYFTELILSLGTTKVICKKISEKHVNYFLDEFYFNKEENSIFVNSRNNLLKIVSSSLKKVYKKIENINLSFDDIKGIVGNFKAFNCHLVLSENNSKVDYLVNFQTDYKPEVFNQNKEGSIAIDNNTESIKLTLDLLLSHYTTLFEPLETGAQLKATNINKIIKSATTQEERNTIREIFGVDYTRLLNEKLVANNSNNKCFISKNFIKKMNISLSDIQFMYNKTQLIDVIGNAIKKLSPNNANLAETAKKLLNSYVKELTKNESCIEIGNINITSTYQLN